MWLKKKNIYNQTAHTQKKCTISSCNTCLDEVYIKKQASCIFTHDINNFKLNKDVFKK